MTSCTLCQVLASSVVAADAAAIAKTALDRFKLEKANDINWRESRKLGNLVLSLTLMVFVLFFRFASVCCQIFSVPDVAYRSCY